MTDFFIRLYSLAHFREENIYLSKIRLYSLLRFVVRLFANIILPLWYMITPNKKFSVDPSSCFVVSLTSFPMRIGRVWITIESIFRQTYKPSSIILWLSKEQFPNGELDLPKVLIKMRKRGLEIKFVEGDIRSHKKYKYLVGAGASLDFVTIDDDIIYSSTLLQRLYEEHRKYPSDVIAAYVHEMTYDNRNALLPYKSWNHNTLKNKNLFFGSGGGTYFPKGIFYKDITNTDMAIKLCPTADDVWLNSQVRLAGHTVRRLPLVKRYVFLEIIRFRDIKLNTQNVYNEHLNDKQICEVVNTYLTLEQRRIFVKE